jgi:hypothetical protein
MGHDPRQAAKEEIAQALAEAVSTGHYFIGLFSVHGNKLVYWSKIQEFPAEVIDKCVDHMRDKAKGKQTILTTKLVEPEFDLAPSAENPAGGLRLVSGFEPEDPELKRFHRMGKGRK